MAMLDCADFEMCPKKAHFGHAGQGAEITMRPHESLSIRVHGVATMIVPCWCRKYQDIGLD